MGEYIPTEQELIDVLCRSRETDWDAAVRRANDKKWSGGFTENNYKGFIKDFRNLRDISQEYMRTPAQWRGCTFSFILGQIVNSPKEDQRLLLELVNRYKETAQQRLLDVVWRDWHIAGENERSMVRGTPEYLIAEIEYKRLEAKFHHIAQDSLSELDMLDITENSHNLWEFLGDSDIQEMTSVNEKSLVWRVLVAQKLLELIDDALRQDQQQAATPAVDKTMKSVNRLKKPAGRRGWACEQICKMQEIERIEFLGIHSGDQRFYNMLRKGADSWVVRYKKVYPSDTSEQFDSAIEKGKQLLNKKPEILNFFTEN